MYVQLYMYIQGSPVKILTPTHWNLNGQVFNIDYQYMLCY